MTNTAKPRRSFAFLLVAICAALVSAVLLASLGVWQIERLRWKEALIARVEQRVGAEPVAAPGQADWSGIRRDGSEYLRVQLQGRFLNDRETLTQAVTGLGGGYWVLTPFLTDGGFTVLVNRGFVPPDRRDPSSRPSGQIEGATSVTGLLRLTEPGGGFLRNNDPAADRWYSRDVEEIGAKRGLGQTAPYFIDADATPNIGGWPVGGLTKITFNNHHLIYAFTWFGLALMALGAVWMLLRDRLGKRSAKRDAGQPRTAVS
ncbi:SURF1 family protein [Oryzicola mucosus]|uniref:SURF1-like protein n=1 Tax=Oryzicola mucosus TaxID=2767425 RepID=A0A8J6PWH9_9HYPH|nr:SURF1 family protein [Oryzicola mucosus]